MSKQWLSPSFIALTLSASFTVMAQDSYVDVEYQGTRLETRVVTSSGDRVVNDAAAAVAFDALAMANENLGIRFSYSDVEFDDFQGGPGFDVTRSLVGIRLQQEYREFLPVYFVEYGGGSNKTNGIKLSGNVATLGVCLGSQAPRNVSAEFSLSRHDFDESHPTFGHLELVGFRVAGKLAVPRSSAVSLVAGLAHSRYDDQDNRETRAWDLSLGVRVWF